MQEAAMMRFRIMCLGLGLATLAGGAMAAEGLVAPTADTLWPQWHARIAVQTASASPLTGSRWSDGNAMQRGLQGGAVLGDYYFANPSFGSFRASGGVLVGVQGGVPLISAAAGPRLGLSVSGGAAAWAGPGAETPGAVPYLGLGFTGHAWHSGLAVTADFGLVAERPGAAAGVGRALFGNQGMESAVHELRLEPVLQLGVRYTF
jgi:hypothetical protein